MSEQDQESVDAPETTPAPPDVEEGLDEEGTDVKEDGGDEEGPDASELDQDPAYDPDDPELKGIKGG